MVLAIYRNLDKVWIRYLFGGFDSKRHSDSVANISRIFGKFHNFSAFFQNCFLLFSIYAVQALVAAGKFNLPKGASEREGGTHRDNSIHIEDVLIT